MASMTLRFSDELWGSACSDPLRYSNKVVVHNSIDTVTYV